MPYDFAGLSPADFEDLVRDLVGREILGATMAVVPVPDFVPRQYKRARIVVLLLAFLGLISLAAAQAMTVECQDEYLTADDGITLLTADDGVTLLTTGRQQCQLVVGGGEFRCQCGRSRSSGNSPFIVPPEYQRW
jgi:hypothetical protein